MNIEELNNLVSSLRTQAKQLEAAADALELSLAPWQASQQVVEAMVPLFDFWKVFLPQANKN